VWCKRKAKLKVNRTGRPRQGWVSEKELFHSYVLLLAPSWEGDGNWKLVGSHSITQINSGQRKIAVYLVSQYCFSNPIDRRHRV